MVPVNPFFASSASGNKTSKHPMQIYIDTLKTTTFIMTRRMFRGDRKMHTSCNGFEQLLKKVYFFLILLNIFIALAS